MHAKRSEQDVRGKVNDSRADDENDEDDESIDDDDESVALADDDDDTSIDVTSEYNVEELMAKLDRTGADDVARRKEIRRRLEEIQEMRSLDDTYSFDLNGDD